MKDLSVVIITYNEEKRIRACLQSVSWANEIVVVDALSSDNTIAICKEFTGRVFQNQWIGFGPQKNFGIEMAQGEWILILDADERVTPQLRKEIEAVLSDRGETAAAYQIPRRNHFFNQWIFRAGQYPDYQLRLFKKGAGRYNDKKLHENLLTDAPIKKLTSPLDHYSCESLSDWLKKIIRYSGLMAAEQVVEKDRVTGNDLFFRPLFTFLKIYLLKSGFRDGIRGMFIAVFASLYTFMKYARMWEKLYGK